MDNHELTNAAKEIRAGIAGADPEVLRETLLHALHNCIGTMLVADISQYAEQAVQAADTLNIIREHICPAEQH